DTHATFLTQAHTHTPTQTHATKHTPITPLGGIATERARERLTQQGRWRRRKKSLPCCVSTSGPFGRHAGSSSRSSSSQSAVRADRCTWNLQPYGGSRGA